MLVTGTTDQIRRGPLGPKLVSIVYADMVGCSRLIGLNDVGTLERMRANVLDPTIAAHGGRIAQTGGDSLLIVFDSIDGAVRCAVQAAVAECVMIKFLSARQFAAPGKRYP
jgi:class 3 adenylate cyclase